MNFEFLSTFSGRLASPQARVGLAAAAWLLLLVLAMSSQELSWWAWIALWAGYWWLFAANLGYVGHLQSHRRLLGGKLPNRLFELVLGLLSGMTVGSWRITHVLGHHRSHWPTGQGSHRFQFDEPPVLMSHYSLSNGLRFVALSVWAQAVGYLGFAWRAYRQQGFRQAYYAQVLREAVVHWAVVVALTLVLPWWSLAFVWVPHLLTHVFSRYVDYLFHAGALETSDYLFCFTCVHPGYNRSAFNTGFHVAHHYWPRAHWATLPALHGELCKTHPELRLAERQVSFSGGLMYLHRRTEAGREAVFHPASPRVA